MPTNLFGEEVTEEQQRRCNHMNANYRLDLIGHVDVVSVYEPLINAVDNEDAVIRYQGRVTGHCRDCGKQFYYTQANTPKFIKRRLRLAKHLRDNIDFGNFL